MLHRLMLKDAVGLGATPRLAVVGAGGKTTFLLQLAREYAPDVLLTTSTHLAIDQAAQVDTHLILHSQDEIEAIFQKGIHGVTLITRDEIGDGRLDGLPMEWLEKIAGLANRVNLPVLIEADGSRRLPIKAPASHEPAIPSWVKEVIVCAGLSGIGTPIDGGHVHRPEKLAELAQQAPGSIVTSNTLISLLRNPGGGLRNIPPGAKRIVLLNQADEETRAAAGGRIARALIDVYDSVLVSNLQDTASPVKAIYAPAAAIILAAGRSTRFDGGQKVLLDWYGEPFVRKIARTALDAQLGPVIVVAGSQFTKVNQVLEGLPVVVVENKDWEAGQSTSIHCGINNLPERVRSVVFMLADQPQVSTAMLALLVEKHRQTVSPIIAPLIEDRRANPVLFDRKTFNHLLALQGDTGGRAIFSKFDVDYLPWLDRLMLLDVDTQDDYSRLLSAYGA